jgi:hypothetical protein
MTSADYSRAIVHAFTNGSEGKSPYIVCDIFKRLVERHTNVQLLELQPNPLRMTFDIDHVRVWVWVGAPEEQTENEMIFYAQCGTHGAVRVNVLKVLDEVPVSVMDKDVVIDHLAPLYTDWMAEWPRCTMSWIDLSSELDQHLTPDSHSQFSSMRYMSEHNFVDAIETAIDSVTVW